MKIRAIVKPNAKNREETVIPGEIYHVITREPAIDGRANLRAIGLLAAHFEVPKTHIRLINGATSRYKTFEVAVYPRESTYNSSKATKLAEQN